MARFTPTFEGPIEGYVVNYLTKHLWRIQRTHTRADAMQEAWVVFLRVAEKYPALDEPQHFMALFKTAWANRFTDLSHTATANRQEHNVSNATDEMAEAFPDMVGSLDNDGMLRTMIRQAPQEVLMVLNLFLSAPQELLDLAFSTWRAQGRLNPGGRKHIAAMLGLPEGSDPIKDTEDYFTHKP